ncbi:MAC/perforin domain-containing protein [Pedobacter alpinus]|uniref:MAC/perforin domain-containing protein n=1 Tax=Pedobacter alpinus TaxID=1590643 RepID=A0ABW5TWB2_9SPHI
MTAYTELLKNYLQPNFVYALNNYSPQQIVADYGTHILKDILIGGKLEVMYRSETGSTERRESAKVGITASVTKIFNITTNLETNYNETYITTNSNSTLSYRTKGGNSSIPNNQISFINGSIPTTTISISDWESTVNLSSSIMIDIANEGLISISELVTDPTKKAALQNYINSYIYANSVQLDNDPTLNTSIFYRLYHRSSRRHHYTADPSELQSLQSSGWVIEGNIGKIKTAQVVNTVPLYRYYNYFTKDHYFSTSITRPNGYDSEGIAGYVYTTSNTFTNPIYQYNYSGGDHLYTNNFSELGNGNRTWDYEGINFYLVR